MNKNNKNNNNNNHRHRTSARARARHAGRRANILSQQKRSRRQNLAELFFFCMARVETWTSSKPMTKLFILGGPDTRDLLLLGIHHRHTIRFSNASHNSAMDEWTLTQVPRSDHSPHEKVLNSHRLQLMQWRTLSHRNWTQEP